MKITIGNISVLEFKVRRHATSLQLGPIQLVLVYGAEVDLG